VKVPAPIELRLKLPAPIELRLKAHALKELRVTDPIDMQNLPDQQKAHALPPIELRTIAKAPAPIELRQTALAPIELKAQEQELRLILVTNPAPPRDLQKALDLRPIELRLKAHALKDLPKADPIENQDIVILQEQLI
jgi:hypothetical protein